MPTEAHYLLAMVMHLHEDGRSLGCAIQLQEGRQSSTGGDEYLMGMFLDSGGPEHDVFKGIVRYFGKYAYLVS